MARQRFIHPDLWSDPTLGQLTPIERLFFIGCFSNADDEGRMLGNPAYLRSIIFPYDDLTIEQVKQMRDTVIETCKNLVLYEVDGLEYLAFSKWSRYQKPKYPKASKFPPPLQPTDGETLEKPSPNLGETLGEDLPPGLGRDGLGRDGLGRDGEENQSQPPELQNPDLTEQERTVLQELRSVPGYSFDFEKDLEHIRTLAIDFPLVDMTEQSRKWRTYKLDKPLQKKSNPRLQFRNWCEIAEKRLQEQQGKNSRAPCRVPRAFASLEEWAKEDSS